MKTLHLTNSYHPTSGGIRHFYEALLHAVPERDCTMRLVVPGDESTVEDVNGSARIYRVRAPRAPFFDSQYRVILPGYALGGSGPIVRILRDEQPDLIEVCDKYSLCYLAGMLRKGWIGGVRRPVLVGLSCERMDDNIRSYLGLGRVGRALSSLYIRRVYVPQFDCHLANSRYTASELEVQARKHRRAVHVLPMGVEAGRFSPSRRTEPGRHALLRRLGGGASTRVVVYAGRLSPEKNVGVLPLMLEQLALGAADYHLVVAGDGPLASRLEADCARRTPLRAHFWQHVGRDTLADLLAHADVFVHPNPHEPFGIAPLEAMASGLPLVAPDTGGVTTYASEETAWLSPPDADSFARRVRQVFDDPSARRRRVARALAVAATYRWEVVATRFLETYEQLVRGTPMTAGS